MPECTFKIVWAGEDVKIQDEESWLEAIKGSNHLTNAGAWFTLQYADGTSESSSRQLGWKTAKRKFRHRVIELMEQEVILKFEKKEADAKEFYDIDGEE